MILKFIFLVFLAFLFIVLFVGVSFVGLIRRILFPNTFTSNQQHRTSTQYQESGTQYSQKSTYASTAGSPQQKRKIIPQDEGEYVDFEEIK